MLLSRFWYLILSFSLAAAAGVLYIAHGFYNRHTERWMNEALMADASVVAFYLKDDARTRASNLLPIALTPELREAVGKSSEANEVPKEQRTKATSVLDKAAKEIPEEQRFTKIYVVDADGRLVAQWNSAERDDWNLGGYSVVADALAGWIRDDAWVVRENLVRVVARPIERDGGGEPIGAVIGLTAVDDQFAQKVNQRTGAKVAFYALGTRRNYGAPACTVETDPGCLAPGDFDVMQSDFKEASATPEYLEKGRTLIRRPRADVGIVYTRVPGEAWDLGAGYIVARKVTLLKDPFEFFKAADQGDKDRVPTGVLVGIGVGLGLLGLLFSVVEHTLPLRTFKRVAAEFASGKVDTLAPSKFRGLYKKIAADVNDGVDKVLSKGGITRRAADLEQVIGPLPAQPQMSAFAVPDAAPAPAPPPKPSSEKRVPAPPPKPSGAGGDDAPRPPPKPPTPSRAGMAAVKEDSKSEAAPTFDDEEIGAASQPMSAPSPVDEQADWKNVYEEFLKTKKQCGESTEGMTFDRFKGTLERNKAALVSRHNCSAVKFTVYVKDGKAALRASPVK